MQTYMKISEEPPVNYFSECTGWGNWLPAMSGDPSNVANGFILWLLHPSPSVCRHPLCIFFQHQITGWCYSACTILGLVYWGLHSPLWIFFFIVIDPVLWNLLVPYPPFLSYPKRSKAELHLTPSMLRWHNAFAEECYWQIFQKLSELCP